MIVHWDDVAAERDDHGHLVAYWTDLGRAAGSARAGVKRIQIDPRRWSTGAHVEGAEEEIFYVLGGSGLSWQDGRTYEVRPDDCIVHRAAQEAHTLRAGDDGLDVLAFGTRVDVQVSVYRRVGVAWLWPTWVEAGAGESPWERELAAGEPEVGEPAGRPPNIVNLGDLEPEVWELEPDMGAASTFVADAAGSVRAGLNHDRVPPGKLNTAPHCHSAEEEIMVVLDGDGTLLLGDEEHVVRRGHVVARPPGTRVAHAFRGGESGLSLLVYGTREPNDISYYPRSGVVALRGVGVVGKIEPFDRDSIF